MKPGSPPRQLSNVCCPAQLLVSGSVSFKAAVPMTTTLFMYLPGILPYLDRQPCATVHHLGPSFPTTIQGPVNDSGMYGLISLDLANIG